MTSAPNVVAAVAASYENRQPEPEPYAEEGPYPPSALAAWERGYKSRYFVID